MLMHGTAYGFQASPCPVTGACEVHIKAALHATPASCIEEAEQMNLASNWSHDCPSGGSDICLRLVVTYEEQ